MSITEPEIAKRAVVFQEGEEIRAVASWILDADKKLHLVSLELEMLGPDAMGTPRWDSYGFVVHNGALQSNQEWLACVLINRANRWLKENV